MQCLLLTPQRVRDVGSRLKGSPVNKQARAPYFALANLPLDKTRSPASLCAFCVYGEWFGDCKEVYIYCLHPLWRVSQEIYEAISTDCGYGDCWGFRPLYALEDCADMIGIWLQGKAVDLSSVPRRQIAPAKKEG